MTRISARLRVAVVCALAALAGAVLIGPPAAATTTVAVTTASGLQAAVKAAKPGTVIMLAKGTYTLPLVLAANGTSTAPITLVGVGATITTGSASKGYGIHVTGDYWVIKGVTVTKALKGIVADSAAHLVIDSVTVTGIGQEGIHFRKSSTDGVVRNSTVKLTGVVDPGYGEGIYVGSAHSNWSSVMGSSTTPDRSDRVRITGNHISSTPAEGIDIKEGTSRGVVSGNVFYKAGYSGTNYADSWVDVKGNSYVLRGNSGSGTKLDAFQTHVEVTGWGRWNRFSTNKVTSGVSGYTVRVAKTSTGTVVACSTLATGAAGLTNVGCTR